MVGGLYALWVGTKPRSRVHHLVNDLLETIDEHWSVVSALIFIRYACAVALERVAGVCPKWSRPASCIGALRLRNATGRRFSI